MDKEKSIKQFEEKSIRTHWDAEAEKWWFFHWNDNYGNC